MTSSGWSPDVIVTRPSGACPNVPSATPAATRRAQRGTPSTRRASTAVASVRPSGTIATARLPNSIAPWTSFSGKKLPCSQPGQLSQPRPEDVRRTAAPVSTIT